MFSLEQVINTLVIYLGFKGAGIFSANLAGLESESSH